MLSRDLQNPRWMYLKTGLFVILGCLSGGLVLAEAASLTATLCLLLTIWAFCRAYFFAFSVIEHYIDPSFRYDGLISALRWFRNPDHRTGDPATASRENEHP